MAKKYFSLPEAQETLSEILPLTQEAMLFKKTLDEINSIEISVDTDEKLEDINFMQLNKDFHYYSYKLFEKLEEIEKLGIIIKDIEAGLLDFPSLFQGREILLCYRFGEQKIEFYHELEEGFKGRKPVVEIEKAMKIKQS